LGRRALVGYLLLRSFFTMADLAYKALNGVGFSVSNQKNVIIRNVKISKVLADYGDAIGIQYSSNIWIDHVDVSSDRDQDKD
jgi:pectate lyase